jgi:zinc protease
LFDQQLVPRDDPALRRATAASIDALSIDDVNAFAATHLRPDVTVIAIVADLDPGQVRRDVQSAFGAWQRPATAPAADQTAIRDWSPSRKVVVAPAQAEHLIIGQPVPGSADDRYPSLLLANELLGVGFDSRLVQALRFRRGLALAATSALIANPGRGILRIDTRVPADRSREAARLVAAELTRLGRDVVTGDELARARAQLESSTIMAHEQPARLAQAELDQGLAVLAGGRAPIDRLSGVTPARLRDDMRAILAPGRLAEVDVGPAR